MSNLDPRWTALAATIIAVVARVAKEPVAGSLFARVPQRFRPHVVAALVLLAGILDASVRGTSWRDAIFGGLTGAGGAMLLHGLLGGVHSAAPSAPAVELSPPSAAPVSVDAAKP